MKAALFALLVFACTSMPVSGTTDSSIAVTLTNRSFTIAVDTTGKVSNLHVTGSNRDLVSTLSASPILQLRVAGKFHAPTQAAWKASGKSSSSGRLTLTFADIPALASVSVVLHNQYLRLELKKLVTKEPIEVAMWGPYSTTVNDQIGEVVGVVRDQTVAVGIQALNIKTLGGFPWSESDAAQEYDADDRGTYPNLAIELRKQQHFRGNTAVYTADGSSVQAYCRNRNQDRTIENWGWPSYFAPRFEDGGIIGSKVALFACPADQALPTIGEIEVAEKLQHPLLGGKWQKETEAATSSYLIVDFSEKTIDEAIEMTRRAGLHYLYHSSPFETWGHFILKKDLFPHGWLGLKACVEKANKAGIQVGFHTLSNFVTPNDAYVTPVPDQRLAKVGFSKLTAAVNGTETEIAIDDPSVFVRKSPMSTVQIGNELIQYDGVTSAAPFKLIHCKRGAFGTAISAHPAGATVAKLMDHDYKVFLTDASLGMEMANNVAKLCNVAGTRQISLDGLEGNWSTGMGQYGNSLFTNSWYSGLSRGLKDQINDASMEGHWSWHIATRMNWGEPWYAGFRESQTLLRFKNQLFFERNLMPHMLGWFAVGKATTLEDVEWMLARAAGYNAGFALVTSLASTAQLEADPHSAEALKKFGPMAAILDAVNVWETARQAGAFPENVRAELRDNSKEFRLVPKSKDTWTLYEVKNGSLESPQIVHAKSMQ